jgi:hypothetical protein
MPQLLDPDDHRFGADPRMIDRSQSCGQDDEVTAPATMQSEAMRRSGA